MYLYEKYTHQGIKRIKHLIQCFSNHFICLFLMVCLLCVNYFGGPNNFGKQNAFSLLYQSFQLKNMNMNTKERTVLCPEKIYIREGGCQCSVCISNIRNKSLRHTPVLQGQTHTKGIQDFDSDGESLYFGQLYFDWSCCFE